MFTKALASLLPQGSTVHAVDVDAKALQKIPKEYNGVRLETSVMDFSSGVFPFHQLDGILMANSLHYVRDKEPFLGRLMNALKEDGCFLLVDYDMNKANHWVPYPLPIAAAEELFLKCNVQSFEVLNKRRSVFGDRMMYAMLVKK
ncbi:MAG: class I SAM-dependent methyltransferase [Flavisolibacter sp.]|nr:class I SAM-dependent methyltransferase [Flavisolibacter sp.]